MELTPSSQKKIKTVVKSIIEHTPCMVDFIGHTDTVGLKEENLQTSFDQSNYIESLFKKEILKVIKVKKEIILTTKGYGEEDLLIPTPDETEETKNRNVEVFIR